jgi:para-nitrobenzyl esterase
MKGVVYVNFNYRLSVLGNLALPELTAESLYKASSNYMHLDEIAVLQWVRRGCTWRPWGPRRTARTRWTL